MLLISSVCTNPDAMTILRFVNTLLTIAKLILPLVIIVVSSIDFGKSVIGLKYEEMKKYATKFMYRLIAGIIVFFIPTIVTVLFRFVDDTIDIAACFENATLENIELAYVRQADIALVKVEASLDEHDYDEASFIINQLGDSTTKTNYLKRLETVQLTIQDKKKLGEITSHKINKVNPQNISGNASTPGGTTNNGNPSVPNNGNTGNTGNIGNSGSAGNSGNTGNNPTPPNPGGNAGNNSGNNPPSGSNVSGSGTLTVSGSYASNGTANISNPHIKLSKEPDPSAAVNYWKQTGFVYPKDTKTGLPLGAWPSNWKSIPTSLTNYKTYINSFIYPVTPVNGTYSQGYNHTGIDMSAPFGTPVYSPADGKMEYSEWGHTKNTGSDETAYTIFMTLDKPVTVAGYKVKYLFLTHMAGIRYRCPKGKCNQSVKKGELLGFVGTAAGSATTGGWAPHLHITFCTKTSCRQGPNTRQIEEKIYSLLDGASMKAGG